MNRRRKSIFFQLTVAFLLLGILPLTIAGAVLYGQFSRNLERVMLKDMARIVAYTCDNVAEMETECDELTKLVYDIPLEDGRWLWECLKETHGPESDRRLMVNGLRKKILERDSKIASAYFIDGQGQVYYATANTQKVLDEDALKNALAQMGLEGPGLSVGPTHVDDYFPQSKNQVLTFSRSYQDVSGMGTLEQSLGRLYVDIHLSKLSGVLEEPDKEQQGILRLVSADGLCIYSTKKEEIGSMAQTGAGEPGELYSGRGRRSDYWTCKEIPGCGWKVALQTPRSALMQNLDQTRKVVLLFVGGSFIVLFLLYGHFLRRLRRPVRELEQGMYEIQKGNFGVRVQVEREDELGHLAKGLNHMAQELEAYIRRVYVAEIRQREAELDALKSQIKPHYLYNTLDVIRMMALDHEDGQTAQMVESLSRQLKYLIGYNSDRVPLYREIDNIREYFVIMGARYEHKIHLELDIAEETAGCPIIKLSLQPIVENAVRHGLRQKGGGTVRIETARRDKELEIIVMDDGVGMDEETLKALQASMESGQVGERREDGWHHVGLKNTYDRIQKNFGPDYGLEIMSDEGVGTVVICHLPFLEGKEEEHFLL